MKNYDIRKIIDDFIFIMMFVGNDFVPRLFGFNIK
jgi:5'-3' exonuclease